LAEIDPAPNKAAYAKPCQQGQRGMRPRIATRQTGSGALHRFAAARIWRANKPRYPARARVGSARGTDPGSTGSVNSTMLATSSTTPHHVAHSTDSRAYGLSRSGQHVHAAGDHSIVVSDRRCHPGPLFHMRDAFDDFQRSRVLAPPLPSKMIRFERMVARPLTKPTLPSHCGKVLAPRIRT